MAKNVLIFFPHRLKAFFGGGYSYLYQLKKAFRKESVKLHFLDDLIHFEEEQDEIVNGRSFLKELVKNLIPSKVIYSRRIQRYLEEKYNEPFLEKVKELDLSIFDAIHFHETIDIWRCGELLKNYKGQVILTSHSPKPYHIELLEDVFGLKKKQISDKAYRSLEAIDLIAFSKADILVSPCPEALDDYKKHWPLFQTLIAGKQQVYIPTGQDVVTTTKSAIEIRQEWKIKEDAFVVCFNGRHSAVKGYDLLTEAARILLTKNKNIYFLITGNKDVPSILQHERWIETGWTTEPQNFVSAADLVVVPNRETYFDLNVLLALSLGKPFVLSNTGGNRFFRQFNTDGILFLDKLDPISLVKAIEMVYHKKAELRSYTSQLQNIFVQQFSLGKFAEHYHRFYLSV